MKKIEIAQFTPEGTPSRAYERVTQLGRDIMALAVRVPRPLLVEQGRTPRIVAVAAGEYMSNVVLKDQNVLLNVEVVDLDLYEDSEPTTQKERPRFRLAMNVMAGNFWHTEDDPVTPMPVGVNPNRLEHVEEFELSGGVFEQELLKKYGSATEEEDVAHPLHLYYMLGEELQDLERYGPEQQEEIISALILSFYVRYGIDTLLASNPSEDQFEYIHGIEDWMILDDDHVDDNDDFDLDYEDEDAPDETYDPGEREPDLLAPAGYVEAKEFDDKS